MRAETQERRKLNVEDELDDTISITPEPMSPSVTRSMWPLCTSLPQICSGLAPTE